MTMADDHIQAEKLELEITHELMEDLQGFSESQGLEFEECMRLILGAGLGFLRADQVLKGVATSKYSAQEVENLVARLVETESRLAATRFRMQELQSANEMWNLSTGAVNTEREGLGKVVWRQKEEIAALKEEFSQLQQENQALRDEIAHSEDKHGRVEESISGHDSGRTWRRWFGWNSPKK